jgi:hypothetical protein
MKQIKKIRWAVRLWWGLRLERVRGRVAGLYFRRVTLPSRLWLAAGRPPQFRPLLPWWHHLALVLLRSLGGRPGR